MAATWKRGLVELMSEYQAGERGVYGFNSSRKHVPPQERLLTDMLVEWFKVPRGSNGDRSSNRKRNNKGENADMGRVRQDMNMPPSTLIVCPVT